MNGAFADKAARQVSPGDSIELVGPPRRFVSRGGDKLAGALEDFGINPAGWRCLDAGASTGGFTDCLLQAGAASVVAIDVGYGQLHERLVGHPQVANHERTNVKDVNPELLGGPVELVVADLSFISVRSVLARLVGACAEGGQLILLVKPQFEAGRAEANRGRGVIKDPAVWWRVLEEVCATAADEGAPVQAATVSPIRGAKGNVEFLVLLAKGQPEGQVDFEALVADAVGDTAEDL